MTYYVYRCYDADGDLLYVGCSKDVEKRLKQHEGYADSWVNQMARIAVEEYPDHESALLVEARAIATEHPYWNTLGRWSHRDRWSEADFQRWGHMLAQRPSSGWWHDTYVRDLNRAYLIRFGKPFPDNPERGFAHIDAESVA